MSNVEQGIHGVVDPSKRRLLKLFGLGGLGLVFGSSDGLRILGKAITNSPDSRLEVQKPVETVTTPTPLESPLTPELYKVGTDLLEKIGIVDENDLNNAACGVAAATMVLRYYFIKSGNLGRLPDIRQVVKYVGQYSQTGIILGTKPEQIITGITKAAEEFNIRIPLSVEPETTNTNDWFRDLKSEIDMARPVILFIPNGRLLGWEWDWDYYHYITVSGYTKDKGIIYHDPWGGEKHELSHEVFAKAWGTADRWSFPNTGPWSYFKIIPQ